MQQKRIDVKPVYGPKLACPNKVSVLTNVTTLTGISQLPTTCETLLSAVMEGGDEYEMCMRFFLNILAEGELMVEKPTRFFFYRFSCIDSLFSHIIVFAEFNIDKA